MIAGALPLAPAVETKTRLGEAGAAKRARWAPRGDGGASRGASGGQA